MTELPLPTKLKVVSESGTAKLKVKICLYAFKVYLSVESDLCIDCLDMCLFKISKANDFLLLLSFSTRNFQNLYLYCLFLCAYSLNYFKHFFEGLKFQIDCHGHELKNCPLLMHY